jgi:hypothetical protein
MSKEEIMYVEGKQFKVDVEKIETIEDVKSILKFLDLHFTPPSKETYEDMKHLLKEVPY